MSIDIGQSPQHASVETYCPACGVPESSGQHGMDCAHYGDGTTVLLTAEPYSHSDDPKMTGMRGVRLSAETGYNSGRAFATDFLDVWVAESGEVEIDGMGRVPGPVAAAWFRAVADHLEDARG